MPLTPGTRLGTYEIDGLVGSGAMGEVYRARDPRLRRDVAIKVLPAGLVDDADRLRRFEQEARAAAALNNPNILTVYDIGHDGTAPYIVSELLEGQTLAGRLSAGPLLPIRKVVDYAGQMARGLAAAHERGIVHRDLKPANVFVTNDGRVKILDFGLAKLTERQGPEEGSHVPTAAPMTMPGVVLGTIGYMSPEQVRGMAADHRSDIFSLGTIVYEMLAGHRAFQADTAAETMTAILNEDPELPATASAPPIPPALVRIVARCLEKRAGARFQSAGDLAFALDALSIQLGSTETLSATVGQRRTGRTAWIVAAVALLAAIGSTTAYYLASKSREAQPLRLSMTLPAGWSLALSSNPGEPTSVVVSPDGRRVALIARRADGPSTILIRDLDSRAARPLAGTEGAQAVFWSADSRLVGFFADGKIKKVGVSGGEPAVLCDATTPFGGGTWSRDGTIVFSMPENGTDKLWKVADIGGQPTEALPETAAHDATNSDGIRPWFLPDGRSLLYVAGGYVSAGRLAVFAGRLGSPDRVKVVETDSSNVQYAEGRLLFLRGTTLVAQPFDVQRLAVTGGPVPVIDRVLLQGVIPGYAVFSVSENGVLAYQTATEAAAQSQLAWVDRQGHTLGIIGSPSNYRGVALSHDETRVAAVVGKASDQNLFMLNLSNGVSTQFTFNGGAFPSWSSDDRSIAFSTTNTGWRKPSNGAGAIEPLLPGLKVVKPFDQSRDGSLLYVTAGQASGVDLSILPGSGGTPFRLAATPEDKRMGKFSPDGRWVAYVSYDRSGQNVWVVPVVGGTGAGAVKWRISTGADGGTLPLWSADGGELFYISGSKMLTGVQVHGNGRAFEVGPSKALFPVGVSQLEGGYSGWTYAVSRDGRFIVIQGADAGTAAREPVSIEVNWTAGLGQ